MNSFDRDPLLRATKGAIFGDRERYRYVLWRKWQHDYDENKDRFVVWVMFNPSIADASFDDPTIRRCISFSRQWGYDGLLVVNLYALVASYPQTIIMAGEEAVGPENDFYIEQVFKHPSVKTVVFAYGACRGPALAQRVAKVWQLALEARYAPLCLGTTKQGFPRHPLYLAKTTAVEKFK